MQLERAVSLQEQADLTNTNGDYCPKPLPEKCTTRYNEGVKAAIII